MSGVEVGAAIVFARSAATIVHIDSLIATLWRNSDIDAMIRRWCSGRTMDACRVGCSCLQSKYSDVS